MAAKTQAVINERRWKRRGKKAKVTKMTLSFGSKKRLHLRKATLKSAAAGGGVCGRRLWREPGQRRRHGMAGAHACVSGAALSRIKSRVGSGESENRHRGISNSRHGGGICNEENIERRRCNSLWRINVKAL
jgi:hypothetical protein